MFRTLTIRSAIALIGLLLLASAAFGQSDALRNDLRTFFKNVDVVSISDTKAASGNHRLRFEQGGKQVELALEPHDIRAANYRSVNTGMNGETTLGRLGVNTFKGSVSGVAGSDARININGSDIEGYFRSAGEQYFVEPATNYSPNATKGEFVVYKMEDAVGGDSFACSSKLDEKIQLGREIASTGVSNVSPTLKRLEIATEADAEYVSTLGGPTLANSEILGILNVVEGLYTDQLVLDIRVVFQHTWSAPDPYTGANPEALVRSFQAYWNANYPLSSIRRDTAHLFTGKAQAVSQGWAFIGVVCQNPTFAYGLSGYVSWAPAKYLITAHEVGHNLGANHVDAAQSCANSLMNASLSGSTPMSFCTYSQSEVQNFTSANNECLTVTSGCRFDFDGDSKADISLFRPSNGAWYLSRSTAGFIGIQFGQAGDRPVAADYDGDGMSDPAIYRNGVWYRLFSATNTYDAVSFGLPTDVPAPADFDGDGKADIAVFRPSTGVWYQQLSGNGAFSATAFGQDGDVPVAADYDGDGKADINLFRPSNGVWYRLFSGTGGFYAVQFGANGDKPVTGDFDGDGKADTAVWRPSTGVWYVLRADNSFYAMGFGMAGDIPVPADFDGDGKADVAVFRPSSGVWYRLNSSNGGFSAYSFGLLNDEPAPASYIP